MRALLLILAMGSRFLSDCLPLSDFQPSDFFGNSKSKILLDEQIGQIDDEMKQMEMNLFGHGQTMENMEKITSRKISKVNDMINRFADSINSEQKNFQHKYIDGKGDGKNVNFKVHIDNKNCHTSNERHGDEPSVFVTNCVNSTRTVTNPTNKDNNMGSHEKPLESGSRSESSSIWVDGKLVYQSIIRNDTIDEMCKQEARKQMFWGLGSLRTNRNLEEWETFRDISLPDKCNNTLKEIEEWHGQELEAYKALVDQYQTENVNLPKWQKLEQCRIDWLIRRTGMTQVDLEDWLFAHHQEFIDLARYYLIPIETLIAYYHHELDRLNSFNRNDFDSRHQQNKDNVINNGEEKPNKTDQCAALEEKYQITLQDQISHHKNELKQLIEENELKIANMRKQTEYELDRLNSFNRNDFDSRHQQNKDNAIHNGEQKPIMIDQCKALEEKYQITLQDQISHHKNELKQLIEENELRIANMRKQTEYELDHLNSFNRNDFDSRHQQNKDNVINNGEEKPNKTDQCEALEEKYQITLQDQISHHKNELKQLIEENELKIASMRKQTEHLEDLKNLPKEILQGLNKIQQFSSQYPISSKDIDEWIEGKLKKLKKEGKLDWQISERERIEKLAKKFNGLTLSEFENKLTDDQRQVKLLAYQYHISVEEIEEWMSELAERLENEGVIGGLKDWQKLLRSKIHNVKDNNQTMADLDKEIQSMTALSKIPFSEIKDWASNEIKRQLNPKSLKDWQINEKNRLEDLNQGENLTREDLENSIKNEKQRIEQEAVDNQVTVEEIEDYIRTEGERMIKPVYYSSSESSLTPWQQHERKYLFDLVHMNNITQRTNFGDRLNDEQIRMQKVAANYGTELNDIVEFWKKEYQNLMKMDLISESGTPQWQISEQKYIEYLISQRKTWSIEELERELINDEEHLQQLTYLHHVTANDIQKQYHSDLLKLLQNKAIYSENLTDWQKIEKNRLYMMVTQQQMSIEVLKEHLEIDHLTLERLASQYNVTPYTLINWQRKEIKRLAKLGYGKSIKSSPLENWQAIERERLLSIAKMVTITKDELFGSIKFDRVFENNLIARYRVSQQELLNFQENELKSMEDNGNLEILEHMKYPTEWQRLETNRLYRLIREQTFSPKNLLEWQTDVRLNNIVSLYTHLTVDHLKNWQRQEMKRIEKVAKHFSINLIELEDFRASELERLQMAAYKDYIAEATYNIWSEREEARLNYLMDKLGLSKDQLKKWRRNVYLLAQGFIAWDTEEDVYEESELNTTTTDGYKILNESNDPKIPGLDTYDELEELELKSSADQTDILPPKPSTPTISFATAEQANDDEIRLTANNNSSPHHMTGKEVNMVYKITENPKPKKLVKRTLKIFN